MTFSLNQIDQVSRKAARGAGLPWGLADEVGKALRWLHIYGLNGASALAELLDRQRYFDYRELAPASLSGVWQAPGGVLDPLVTGASLGDCIDRTAGDQIETGAIAYPILAAGFIGNLAEIEDLALTLTWPGVRLCCRRGGVYIDAQQRAVEIETAGFLCCRQSPPEQRDFDGPAFDGQWRAPRPGGVVVESGVWERLEQYARRTYIEATESSRIAGAGAGLHDND